MSDIVISNCTPRVTFSNLMDQTTIRVFNIIILLNSNWIKTTSKELIILNIMEDVVNSILQLINYLNLHVSMEPNGVTLKMYSEEQYTQDVRLQTNLDYLTIRLRREGTLLS